MLITRINIIRNNDYIQYKNHYASKINFNGKLEDNFFEAASQNDIKTQLKALSSINFDVVSK